MASSVISVDIVGNSASLQAATDEAAGSLRELGAASATTAPEVAETGVAADEASGGFNLLGGSLVRTLAPLLALFAGYEGIKKILSDAKSETDTWNNAQVQLANTLKNGAGVIGVTQAQIDALADSTSKNTAITNANTLAADAQLANAKLSAPVYELAAKSIDNIGTAMANARGVAVPSSQQMAQAAKLLGTALQDPATGVNALKRAGIELTAEQQDQIKALQKSGDTVGAQTLLMNDFAAVTQGKASAATDTFTGKVALLQKTISQGASPFIRQFEKDLENLANTIANDVIKAYDFLKPALDNLYKAFQQLGQAIEAHKQGLEDLAKVIGAISIVAIYMFIDTIAALVKAFADVINWVSDAIGYIDDFIDAIKTVGGSIKVAVGAFPSLLYDAGKALIQGLINGVKDAAGAAVDAVKNVGSDIVNAAKSVLKIFSPSAVFSDIGSQVGAGLVQGIQGTQSAVTAASSQLATSAITGASTVQSASNSIQTANNSASQTVNIGTVNLQSADAVQAFWASLDQDNISISKGLSPARGFA